MLTPEQQQYLREHRLAALGTGRRDGSPQLTWIAYEYDGTDVVLQTGGDSVKARNIRRSNAVALLVPDGGRNLVVYGTAAILESGPERLAAIRRARATSQRPLAEVSDADLEAELDARGTVALRIVPDRAMGRIVERRPE
ncbi:MAG: pyridoxamine 5'-phosphate oxidase family protein [Dehalococcoidia bacterium]|nr:pyridoxamine 5'-phosphate oxidase family protein [Dehalococcoidia bacterium]